MPSPGACRAFPPARVAKTSRSAYSRGLAEAVLLARVVQWD